MWRIICIGPAPMDRVRRLVDRGPLHDDKARAEGFAHFLRGTGLYERVHVVSTQVTGTAGPMGAEAPAPPGGSAELDDLSKLFD